MVKLIGEKEKPLSTERLWLAGMIAGMIMIISAPILFPGVLIHSWTILVIAILAVSGIFVPCRWVPWLTGSAVACNVAFSLLLSSEVAFMAWGTLLEASAVTFAGLLSYRIGSHLHQLEKALLQTMLIRHGVNLQSQETVQKEMEREIRRARRFERPLSLLCIESKNVSAEVELHDYLKQIVSQLENQIRKGQIAELFASQTKANDILSFHNGKFLILLPETEKQQAEALAQRLNLLCEQNLKLSIQTTAASFPGDELTLSGLISRTADSKLHEKEMRLACDAQEKAVEEFVLQEIG